MRRLLAYILLTLVITSLLTGITSASILEYHAGNLEGPLLFSTLTGHYDFDEISGVGMDEEGSIYAAGMARAIGDLRDDYDCFLMKINGTDFSQEFDIFFGGSESESVSDMFIDPAGRVYVTGFTNSPDFPVQEGYCEVYQNSTDCFVICFDSDGSIIFSTLFGGHGTEVGESIFVDSEGSIYITGKTESYDFPLVNSYSNRTGWDYVFVSKFNSTGNGLLYSSIVGQDSRGLTVTADSEGNAYVAGVTISEDFPTINAYSDTPNQLIPFEANEGFVFKMNSTGNGLIFSTFIGGTASEVLYDIELDSQGNVWVCGYTESSDFPSVNNFSVFKESTECVLFELSSNGSALLFSTVFGGGEDDTCYSMEFDNRDNLYITGSTRALQFPLIRPERYLYDFTDMRDYRPHDCFVMKISPEKSILYSTVIGGRGSDWGKSIEVIENGAVIVGGHTASEGFPIRPEISDASYATGSRGDGFILILLDISDEDADSIPNWWETANGFDPLDSNTPLIEYILWYAPVITMISIVAFLTVIMLWSQKHRIRTWTSRAAASF